VTENKKRNRVYRQSKFLLLKKKKLSIFRIFSTKILSGNSTLFTEREQWTHEIFSKRNKLARVMKNLP